MVSPYFFPQDGDPGIAANPTPMPGWPENGDPGIAANPRSLPGWSDANGRVVGDVALVSSPQFAVPYDSGQINRTGQVTRSLGPNGMPSSIGQRGSIMDSFGRIIGFMSPFGVAGEAAARGARFVGNPGQVAASGSPGYAVPVAIDHAPHPGMAPEDYGPTDMPTPPTGSFGPQEDQQTSLPSTPPAAAAPPAATAPNSSTKDSWMAALGRLRMGAAPGVPMAGMPASNRYSSTRPEFIYTNPAAAQQATANYQARLGFEANQDQGYRDYLARTGDTRARAESEAQRLQAISQEGAANRATSERIASIQEQTRQFRQDEAVWAQNERAADRGDQIAGMLNQDPNRKDVDRKWAVQDPKTGQWVSAFKHKPRPVPPSFAVPPPQGGGPIATPSAVPPAPPEPTPFTPKPAPAAVAPQPGMLRRIWDWTTPGVVLNRFLTPQAAPQAPTP